LRIMRIAVHPDWQRQGVGTVLFQRLRKCCSEKDYDWWGTSFGATLETLAFWQKAGMETVRLGTSRDASSGTHSAILLQGNSEKGTALVDKAVARFQKQLPALLRELYADLEPELVQQLFSGHGSFSQHMPDTKLDDFDLRELEAFSQGQRQFESCLMPLQQLILYLLYSKQVESIDPADLSLAIGKLLQGKPWSELAKSVNYPGKKAMLYALQELTGQALSKIKVKGAI